MEVPKILPPRRCRRCHKYFITLRTPPALNHAVEMPAWVTIPVTTTHSTLFPYHSPPWIVIFSTQSKICATVTTPSRHPSLSLHRNHRFASLTDGCADRARLCCGLDDISEPVSMLVPRLPNTSCNALDHSFTVSGAILSSTTTWAICQQ